MYFDYEEFFPKRISELRVQKGVSARDMSLSIGQNENYINRIENKNNFSTMRGFFYICDYFDITPQEFWDNGNDNPGHLRNLIEKLKKLNEKSLTYISGIADELISKK